MSAPGPNRTTGVLLSPIQAAQLLERVVHEQIAAMFDFDALRELDDFLVMEMMDIAEIDADEAMPLAKAMLDRGLAALSEDYRRLAYRIELPSGDDCELCEQEARIRGQQRARQHARSGRDSS